MSNHNPYDGYLPNEPWDDAPHGYGAGVRPPDAGGVGDAYAQAGYSANWEEAGYTPNEPADAPDAAAQPAYDAYAENRYTRPTWDEAAYLAEAAGTPRRRRSRSATYDAPAQDAAAQPYADETEPPMADASAADKPPTGIANPYRRPPTAADEAMAMSARFAPPLKFEMPRPHYAEPADPDAYAAPAEPTLYQTRKPAYQSAQQPGFDPLATAPDYRLEDGGAFGGGKARRGRGLRRLLIAVCVLAVLGGAAYFGRDFLLGQVANLLGNEAAETVNQAIGGTGASQPTAAFDPAPTTQVGDKAKRGIAAVAGTLDLAPYAVTARNVVARTMTAQGVYDYYLFAAADGQLLGYYEGLGENDFLVCADDIYYVPEAPYLIDAEGMPLIDASRYRQAAGADAVIGPMINGWAIITNDAGTASNYINAKGELLSALWFARAWPFTAAATLAWVDTGNVTEPEERYALYQLARTGEMKLWKHAADMEEVLGCAAGVAVLAGGEVVRLDNAHTSLGTTDDATVYADCGALVARDPATGKYALFVGGDQHYDFAYDRIAPVPSDIHWAQRDNGLYHELTVTGMAYPLPLSHYFALQKGAAQEMVALSTGSVYPLRLQ